MKKNGWSCCGFRYEKRDVGERRCDCDGKKIGSKLRGGAVTVVMPTSKSEMSDKNIQCDFDRELGGDLACDKGQLPNLGKLIFILN